MRWSLLLGLTCGKLGENSGHQFAAAEWSHLIKDLFIGYHIANTQCQSFI